MRVSRNVKKLSSDVLDSLRISREMAAGQAPLPQSLANLRPWTAEDRAKRWHHGPRVRLSTYVRQHTHEGQELVDFMLRVLRGEHVEGLDRVPRMRERLFAVEWLADRAFGKPKEHLEVEDGDTGTREERLMLIAAIVGRSAGKVRPPLSDCTAEEVAELRMLIEKVGAQD